jgi:lipid II:glycine glycyltransferase (peptidoglycan interpeptide bridge formation enzyme)
MGWSSYSGGDLARIRAKEYEAKLEQRIAALEAENERLKELLREEHELTGCYQDERYQEQGGVKYGERRCHVCAALAPDAEGP